MQELSKLGRYIRRNMGKGKEVLLEEKMLI